MSSPDASDAWDYVVVGSGAGGGTLAARLAEAGMRVFLIEAGGDPANGDDATRADYAVPAFHSFACENAAMRWDFRVKHYGDDARQARDPKAALDIGVPGSSVLYPRAATLGGCTAHNAMIYVRPHDSDWDGIAATTGDASWTADAMARYAVLVDGDATGGPTPGEAAVPQAAVVGWLPPESFVPADVFGDDALLQTFAGTTVDYLRGLAHPLASVAQWARSGGDPNVPTGSRSFEGLCHVPLSTRQHARRGVRERVLEARAGCARAGGVLHIEFEALAERVVIDNGIACGVAYRSAARAYRADPDPADASPPPTVVYARREVVLCGGSFNTPQLLMLSGIGPAPHLAAQGIDVVVDLPGVGGNLQDRYEVAVTHRMAQPWHVLAGARFDTSDPLYACWRDARGGMYASNGAALALIRRSRADLPEPDIFLMALLARFEGYRPGFSEDIRDHLDALTWAVLKAHTVNRAGTVRLRSADPRDLPAIEFRYFDEGSDAAGEDLAALIDAVTFVRGLAAPLIAQGVIAEELSPGPGVATPDQIADWVRDTAWGHHASGSCAIGGDADPGAVLDSAFRVRGVPRLRVVDASIFPRIPGFFITSAIYIAAEKAADCILRDAAAGPSATS